MGCPRDFMKQGMIVALSSILFQHSMQRHAHAAVRARSVCSKPQHTLPARLLCCCYWSGCSWGFAICCKSLVLLLESNLHGSVLDVIPIKHTIPCCPWFTCSRNMQSSTLHSCTLAAQMQLGSHRHTYEWDQRQARPHRASNRPSNIFCSSAELMLEQLA